MNRFSIAAVTLAAALLLVPAEAASVLVSASAPAETGAYQVKATKVAFDDLDVSTSQGAATLLARIETASRFVCGERQGRTMDDKRAKQFATCRAQAIADAVKAVGAPQLTQLAASH